MANGFTTFHYPSGAKSSEGTLVNGKPDGWWKSYDEKGNLTSEGNRKNFVLDSIWTFYEKGRKYLTVNYVNGKKQGEQILYNPTNYVITQWEDDTIVGAVKTYDNDHWLLATVPHVEGKPHGMAKEFNKDGLVTKVTYYYHGVLNRSERINRTDKFNLKQGAWKYFWDNGNLKLEGSYVNDKKHGFFKYYDGIIFHRIIDGFMIQTGGYYLEDNSLSEAKEVPTIKGEFSANGVENNLKHTLGVVSMARANDMNSASSQFFICSADAPHLDGNYAAFEERLVDDVYYNNVRYKVISGGKDVTDKMKKEYMKQIKKLSQILQP